MRRLVVVADSSQVPRGRTLLETLGQAAVGGADLVILRELDKPDEKRAEIAAAVLGWGVDVIAAHRQLPGCLGVHLPAGDQVVDGLWGKSCHSRDDVERASSDGAAYVTLGPFAETLSKPGYAPIGREEFAGHRIPVYALGGIDADNAQDAIAAGAAGVAVMGAVMRAPNPAGVVRDLLRAVS